MTFEDAVNDAANMARGGDMRFCAAMLRALEALAAERAEARKAAENDYLTATGILMRERALRPWRPPEPRSISHWGMFA